ncbi:hypothetical protein [Alteromonas stellipolaris]|uniref:Uncharacterized protein n=1 Tax=Alteromonas stellipolaris TaxID=233316 RepID=A0AAW7Z8L4_9ALTE|nr:hypothetical protein [Alteromonas stellipolaris]MDO6579353.1 hypothetical protein [Alteromonas stellipolaris]
MSKWKFKYGHQRPTTPISYWVHKGVGEDDTYYSNCTEFTPPFPKKDVIKGYPFLTVTVLSFDIYFASMFEVNHFLSVMEQKNLPTTMALTEQRGRSLGPNNHWLSRFPARLKSWKKRETIILAVKKAQKEIESSGISF